MNPYLAQYIGKTVEVWSPDAAKDFGTLVAVDAQWVVLQRGGETLFFSIARIRLLKPKP